MTRPQHVLLQKRTNIAKQIAILSFFSFILPAGANPKPEDKPGYDKSKDVGTKAPKGADVLFDGTQKSIDDNWEMWPKRDMKITWSLVKSPTDDSMVLMTNGGKRGESAAASRSEGGQSILWKRHW